MTKKVILIAVLVLAILCVAQILLIDYLSVELLQFALLVVDLFSLVSIYPFIRTLVHPYTAFWFTMNVFLCGRIWLNILELNDIPWYYTTYFSSYAFSLHEQKMILLILLVAFVYIELGYLGSSIFIKKHDSFNSNKVDKEIQYRNLSKFIMKVSILPALIGISLVVYLVMSHGYTYIYQNNEKNNFFMHFFVAYMVGFYLYLSTHPLLTWKNYYLIAFFFLLIASLFVGSRTTFAVNMLTIVVYYCMYIKKVSLKKLISCFLISVVVLQFIAYYRSGGSLVEDRNYFAVFSQQQGVSITVLGYAVELENYSSIHDVMYPYTGYIMAKIYGDKYTLAEKAKISFPHKISDNINSDMYYDGKGTGSSFLAELYSSGGLFLVLVSCLVIGTLLEISVKYYNRKSVLLNFSILIFWNALFFMPRSSFLTGSLDIIKYILFLKILSLIFGKVRFKALL